MTSSPTDDWPEHSAELGRKTLEQVHKVLFLVDTNRLNPKIAAFTLNTLCDAIQGLVTHEDFDLVYGILKELRNGIKEQKTYRRAS